MESKLESNGHALETRKLSEGHDSSNVQSPTKLSLTILAKLPSAVSIDREVVSRASKSVYNDTVTNVSTCCALRQILMTSQLNILLGLVPFALLSYYLDWPDGLTFALSLLAIAPLAERLGFVTEQMALHTTPAIGGLLNATFGNATELIISIVALFNKYFRLVQLSLLGSVLSNLLLVMGTSFFLGGLKYRSQTYSKLSNHAHSPVLMLACMGLLFPTVLNLAAQDKFQDNVMFSRLTSIILLVLYSAHIYNEVGIIILVINYLDLTSFMILFRFTIPSPSPSPVE